MPYIQLAAHQYVRGARAHVYLCLDKIHSLLIVISGPNTLGAVEPIKKWRSGLNQRNTGKICSGRVRCDSTERTLVCVLRYCPGRVSQPEVAQIDSQMISSTNQSFNPTAQLICDAKDARHSEEI